MKYRPYSASDKEDLLRIFHSNCPKYFDHNDENDFIDFLDNYTDHNYLVVLINGKIIGCGGHYTKKTVHGIAWVLFERKALGTRNLLTIADQFYKKIEANIITEGALFDIHINTTQLMEQLFNRYGFITYETIKDGFGKGLDEYKMKKTLQSN